MASTAHPDVPSIDRYHLLVIGAGPGLGAAIARRFARGGYRVTLLARDVRSLKDLASDLQTTILFTGGGFADRPVASMATVSLGKAALRSAATMLGDELAPHAVRVASITVAGVIAEDTPFSPTRIADAYWTIARSEGTWQSEFRFEGT